MQVLSTRRARAPPTPETALETRSAIARMTATDTAPSVVTLGCRLNAYEAELMRGHAAAAGLTDTVIVNTCAVTAESVRQATQSIRRIRRERPAARIVVTGCAAQIETARFADMPEVDHVLGNAEKTQAETFRALAQPGSADASRDAPAHRVIVGDIMIARAATTRPPSSGLDGYRMPARAFVQIQNGCDHRCTFCVIPYGRGPSRSEPAAEVVARIRRLVEHGVREVVLTGVDITAWGDDLPDARPLGHLVRQILRQVPELQRLRLSSIDQAETDPDLLAALAEEPRLMPHLHVSLQSGNDLILKRMKRRHSRAQSVAFCSAARRLRPDIAVGADLIAGFPTESEDQFRDTVSIVDDCGLAFLHVFPYSPRAPTPAARMPQLSHGEIRQRAARLRDKGQAVLDQWLGRQIGSTIAAVLERDGSDDVPARSAQFAHVGLRGVPAGGRAGEEFSARVVGQDGRRLLAEAWR